MANVIPVCLLAVPRGRLRDRGTLVKRIAEHDRAGLLRTIHDALEGICARRLPCFYFTLHIYLSLQRLHGLPVPPGVDRHFPAEHIPDLSAR